MDSSKALRALLLAALVCGCFVAGFFTGRMTAGATINVQVEEPDVYTRVVTYDTRAATSAAAGVISTQTTAARSSAAAATDMQTPAAAETGQTTAADATSATASSAGTTAADTTRPAGGLVRINTASQAELETLPGIGPVLAQRIIEYRTQHGPFRSKEALTQVSGIGDRRLAEIRDLITLD